LIIRLTGKGFFKIPSLMNNSSFTINLDLTDNTEKWHPLQLRLYYKFRGDGVCFGVDSATRRSFITGYFGSDSQ
jgi:hypothetical protein